MITQLKKQHIQFMIPAVLSFILTAALLLIVYYMFGFYPFGENSVSWGDMDQQVIPLMLEFRDILEGNSALFLNLQNAGGMNFWGVLFFFLASPFSFSVLFIEKSQIFELVNLLILVKMALAAVTASVFFLKIKPGLSKLNTVTLSCAYALCGYGLLYYQNIVWLDMMYLFPLTLLGLYRVIKQDKAGFLCIMLTVTVCVNYYLSYMVFLYLILSSVILLSLEKREVRARAALKLGVSALMSLLVTAIIWLPSFLQILSSARTGEGVLASLQNGAFFTKTETTLPVVISSFFVAAIPFLAMFFELTAYRKRLLLLLLLTAIPLFIEPVNKMWHTGSYQAFPVRYGYMTVFTGLLYTADIFSGKQFQPEHRMRMGAARYTCARKVITCFLLLALSGASVFILLCNWQDLSSYTQTMWFTPYGFLWFGIFSLFAAVWFCFVLKLNVSPRVLSVSFLLICVIQSLFNASVFIGTAADLPEQKFMVNQATGLETENRIYRTKTDIRMLDVNYAGAVGLYTLNHYTSLTDSDFMALVKQLGYSSYWMEVSSFGGTEISDFIMSNRYVMNELYETRKQSYVPSLGMVIKSGVLPEDLGTNDRYEIQKGLLTALTGSDTGIHAYSYQSAENCNVTKDDKTGIYSLVQTASRNKLVYEIEVGEKQSLYFDLFDDISNKLTEPINKAVSVTVNGIELRAAYPTKKSNGILKLGEFENETVLVEIELLKSIQCRSFQVFGIEVDCLAPLLMSGTIAETSIDQKGNTLRCEVAVQDENRSVFLSIAYADGMEITVNGKPAQYRIVLGSLLEIPLEKGVNTVALNYIPKGIMSGGMISGISILLCVLLLALKNTRSLVKLRERTEEYAYKLLLASMALVISFIYVAPVIIYCL